MKKLVLLLSALFAALVFVGCFDSDDTDDSITIDWVDLADWTNAEAGDEKIFQYTLSASSIVTEANITVSFEDSATSTSATNYFTTKVSEFSSQYTYKLSDPKSYVTVTVNNDCPTGTYYMTIKGKLGTSTSSQEIRIRVKGVDPVEITSVADATVNEGDIGATTAKIANGSSLTKDKFSVSVAGGGSINANDTVPAASIASYVTGTSESTVTISINATNAKAGTYTATLKVGTVEKDFTITVEKGAVTLTEKTASLYNPWGAKESAYNLVTGEPVLASGPDNGGYMTYSDSSIVDIALDNEADIRNKTVAEITSVNKGMFEFLTDGSGYANATDVSVKALAANATFPDNEMKDFEVGDVYLMKLAASRGYVILKITAIDHVDVEGSTSHTGKVTFNYKYTAM